MRSHLRRTPIRQILVLGMSGRLSTFELVQGLCFCSGLLLTRMGRLMRPLLMLRLVVLEGMRMMEVVVGGWGCCWESFVNYCIVGGITDMCWRYQIWRVLIAFGVLCVSSFLWNEGRMYVSKRGL